MENLLIVQTMYPNKGKDLKKLIIWILKQGLAKSAQRVNYIKSYYVWEWKIEKSEEKLLIFKTTASKKDQLISFIKKMHPYEVPEIIVLQPTEVDEQYLGWINQYEEIKSKK